MVITPAYYCALQGKALNPAFILNHPDVIIEDYNFVGDIAKSGRYKGRAHEFGYVRFACKKTDSSLEAFLDIMQVSEIRNIVSRCSCKELHVCLEYSDQCNWEFSPLAISLIHKLGLTLTLTCYKFPEN